MAGHSRPFDVKPALSLPTSADFGGKRYELIRAVSERLAYGEKNAKERAESTVKKLRRWGFAARVKKENVVRDPRVGSEVYFNAYARKDGMTKDEVRYYGGMIDVNIGAGAHLYYHLSGKWKMDMEKQRMVKVSGGRR